MPQAETRRAARIAAAVAIPSALLAGVGFYALSGGFATPAPDGPAPGSTAVPVQVAGGSLDERQATVCRALVAKLPDKVRDLNRRPVSAGTEQNAAYGDPALTLACAGGPRPSPAATETVYPLSGVCWYAKQVRDGTVWTTLDREVPVVVTVPARYSSPGQWVAAFSAPIVATVPSAPGAPFGCTG